MRNPTPVLVIAGLMIFQGNTRAQEPGEIELEAMVGETLEETSSQTHHSIRIDDTSINYTATAGTYVLKNEHGKDMASMFYMAYMMDDVDDYSTRPLLFSFNGGPGTASVWLHMGVLGPRRVVADHDGFALQPPYKLVDNEYSILDVADVVFIDPIATGYSRMARGEDPHAYHGTMEDIESVAEFIRMWVTRNNRWESPKFLIGESYGTTRASGLAGYLQEEHLMFFNGVILVSMTGLGVDISGDIRYALILPHYTATAWYHKQLPPDLQDKELLEVLAEVEEFAMNDYLLALTKGGYLTDSEKSDIISRTSRFTGLSPDYVRNCNLRIDTGRFRKELLRDQGLTVGRLDSRYTGRDPDAAGEENAYDQALVDWEGTFAGAFNHYIRTELNYRTDLSYEIWGDVRPWNSDDSVVVGEMLRDAMTRNKFLQVLITEGYYDAACDYFTAQYVFSHLDMTGLLKDRIHFAFYESGHMMYIHIPSLVKMKMDMAEFIRSAVQR
jgi:carboxypeptidase C (cathepsin A)